MEGTVPHTGDGAWDKPRCMQQLHRLQNLEKETVSGAEPPRGGYTRGTKGGARYAPGL